MARSPGGSKGFSTYLQKTRMKNSLAPASRNANKVAAASPQNQLQRARALANYGFAMPTKPGQDTLSPILRRYFPWG